MPTERPINKKGFASIYLTLYFLVMIVIVTSVLYTTVNLATRQSRQQAVAIQNNYYLERGLHYTVCYFVNVGAWPSSAPVPNVSAPVAISVTGSTYPYTISATRSGKTIRATYERGGITKYTHL